ncbi:non-secretory ribonuclease [Pteropus vampyrus]|uniref:Non-secretory ribonuclease n=1 Tax=Pteropus vampyrus TaxID=132908 RepID=A0A6P3RIT7_PTEVA|nr:non-secretory ribonuclease [Pteropus vampyrus]
MVPTQRDSRLCLLLLLGLLGVVIAFHGVPGNLTPAQWFEVQHINMTNSQCNIAMQPINKHLNSSGRKCKRFNTFLNTTFAAVANVCTTRNGTCHTSHYTNCHNSSFQVSVTNCNLTTPSKGYLNCRYSQSQALKFYTVACECRTRQDSATHIQVPVHLDWIF